MREPVRQARPPVTSPHLTPFIHIIIITTTTTTTTIRNLGRFSSHSLLTRPRCRHRPTSACVCVCDGQVRDRIEVPLPACLSSHFLSFSNAYIPNLLRSLNNTVSVGVTLLRSVLFGNCTLEHSTQYTSYNHSYIPFQPDVHRIQPYKTAQPLASIIHSLFADGKLFSINNKRGLCLGGCIFFPFQCGCRRKLPLL